MATKTKVTAGLAIPPGYYIADEIEERQMSQTELARQMGRPPQAINEIIKGKKQITAETAIQLEKVFAVDARTWLNLESSYRLALARGKPHIDALDDMEPAKDERLKGAFTAPRQPPVQ